LGAINGKPAQGTWNLRIRDTAPGDTGTLYCWQLQVAYQPFACCSGGGPSDPFTTWQNHYFTPAELGNPAFSGSGADPLGKGINNTNQFLAGFNPTNSAAYPHIISVARTSGTNTTVTYLGASGDSTYLGGPASRTNVLESTTGTANGSYSNNFVSTGITNILSGGTGLGQVATMVHTNGGTGPTRYYRIRVLLP
jgi:hypothetical protein